MKKKILMVLAAICCMFTISDITASAAEPQEVPEVKAAVENILAATPMTYSGDAEAEIAELDDPVIVTDASYSSKGVKISWEPYEHEDLLGYMIIRLCNEGGEFIEDESFNENPGFVNADETSYVDNTAENGEFYAYGVVACIGDETGITATSNTEDPSYIIFVAALNKPTLSLSNTTDGIKLSWSQVENADGYQIFRKKYSGEWDYLGAQITDCKTVSYIDTSAAKGTSYYYMVAPLLKTNIYGDWYYWEGSCSSSKYMKRLARPSVTVSNQSSYIKLSWKEIKGATSYNIYRDGEYIKSTSKLTWKDESVSNGKKYTYQVRAKYTSSSGKKYYSAKSAKDIIYRLSRSSIKSLKDVKAAKSFKVTWGKNSKATGYQIEYSRYSSFKNSITKKVKGCSTTSQTIKTNYTKKTYYVRVRPYKTVDGKTYYGAWCTTKKVYVK